MTQSQSFRESIEDIWLNDDGTNAIQAAKLAGAKPIARLPYRSTLDNTSTVFEFPDGSMLIIADSGDAIDEEEVEIASFSSPNITWLFPKCQ